MKKHLFGIFAHPDDEAFGPSATLYKAAQAGTEVHLILLTDGDSGYNAGYDDLAATRLKEWQTSAKLIGATSTLALHYPDGRLCNNMYLEIADKIMARINEVLKSNDFNEVNIMTFEPGGISGHLDHIAASYIATYVYEKIKSLNDKNLKMGLLKYFCLPEKTAPSCNCNWLFMPAGKPAEIVDEVVDFTDIADIKLQIMRVHKSQKKDLEEQILADASATGSKAHKCCQEHFIYYR